MLTMVHARALFFLLQFFSTTRGTQEAAPIRAVLRNSLEASGILKLEHNIEHHLFQFPSLIPSPEYCTMMRSAVRRAMLSAVMSASNQRSYIQTVIADARHIHDHDGFPQTELVVVAAISGLILYVNHHAVVIVWASFISAASTSFQKPSQVRRTP